MADLDLMLDEIQEHRAHIVRRREEKTLRQLRHAIDDTDHRAHGGNHVGTDHLVGKSLAELFQPLAYLLGALKNMAHGGGEFVAVMVDERNEQIFLVGEVDIDRALGNARFPGDVVHAGGVEALALEHAPGAGQNLVAFGRVFARRKTPGGVSRTTRFRFRLHIPVFTCHHCRLLAS
ncbi:hypothetical protein D3C86_1708180 [compost metagenome]